MADGISTELGRPKRLASARRFQTSQAHAKKEIRRKLRKVSNILKKKETERTEDEISTLHLLPDIVKTAEKNVKRQLQQKERVLEIEDEPEMLDQKCQQLAQMLLSAKNAIMYTGAGISTAASIPDYRGPNGVWTLLKKGQSLRAQDLVDAEPTYTHMCITKLFKDGRLKYLVSQNCDGLHVRSGFPRHSLSEVHGNMFIEICKNCKPQKEYLRLFDVTERTAKCRHKTGRTCNKCGSVLYDCIVHFGEKGGLKSPYRWKQAAKAASKSDLIICLGSSLKVLRRYPCLWRMDMRPEHRPKLVIVNLQWTPKDERASLKIHGRCDDVLRKMAQHLSMTVPEYHREMDPLFKLHTPVQKKEELIASQKVLKRHSQKPALPTVNKKKVLCSATNGLSSHHRNTSFKSEYHESSSGDRIVCLSASSNLPQMCLKAEDQHCNGQNTHQAAKSRHILSPIRMKLEEMLKKRGVIDSAMNGKVGLDENNFCSVWSSSGAPLPGIQNFLQQGECESTTQQTHPFLCNLLNSSSSASSQEQSVKQEHNVFRVDLSTNPISITSTQGFATDLNLEVVPVIDVDIPTKLLATVGAERCLHLPNVDHTKLVRNIHFDHSYSKTHHKSRPAASKVSAPKELMPCSAVEQPQQSCHLFSLPSVIPANSISSSVHVVPENMHFSLWDDSGLLSTVGKTIGNIPATLILPASQDCLPHPVPSGASIPQDKVVINLNSGAGFASHPCFSAMQSQAVVFPVSGTQPPISCSSNHSTQRLLRYDNNVESDGQSGNQAKKKAPTSVPGWFGKGLRVRRKRTL